MVFNVSSHPQILMYVQRVMFHAIKYRCHFLQFQFKMLVSYKTSQRVSGVTNGYYIILQSNK